MTTILSVFSMLDSSAGLTRTLSLMVRSCVLALNFRSGASLPVAGQECAGQVVFLSFSVVHLGEHLLQLLGRRRHDGDEVGFAQAPLGRRGRHVAARAAMEHRGVRRRYRCLAWG